MPIPESDSTKVPELVSAIGSAVSWIWLLAIAAWGGTASYIARIRKSKTAFSFMELAGECSISGFSGVLTAFACLHVGVDQWATYLLVGISGHMGGRAIGMAEDYFSERAKRLLP